MYNISHKYKRSLLLLLKLAIVLGAFYFIYQKLINNQLLSIIQLKEQFLNVFSLNIWSLLMLLLFTDINWLLEIFKWKTLASVEKNLNFFEAYQQCLASLTASIITPSRIGEYGVKAMYFEKKIRKKIILLNLIGNLSQLTVTLIFGLIGVAVVLKNFSVQFPKLNTQKFLIATALIGILYLLRKRLNLAKIKAFLKQIPSVIFLKTFAFSLTRYIVFTHQFYFLLLLFGIEIEYFTALTLISTMYFMASIIPGLAIFDWLIKGSIAVLLFSFLGINELTIVTITTLMWILNFAIPSLIGSIFVFNFKLIEKK